ncbi:hypothetical protein [Lacipirellula sp.]|uniref:hypothetical protein n=1 Tax=Lacipirellula sp. TaxID=2691419 RepID=UPI003D0E6130
MSELDKWILNNDVQAMQTKIVTPAMREKWKGNFPYESQTKFVPTTELEARADRARQVETHNASVKMSADYDAFENMSGLEREELGARQWVQLVEGQLAIAVSRRRPAEIEKFELKLQQAKDWAESIRVRQAALEVQRTTDLALQAEPAFRYALTSAESYDLDYRSDDATELGVYVQRLKAATPENWREVVKEFHRWESQRFARIAQEKQAAESAALQAADGPIRELNQLGVDAADAGLKSAEALGRANRLSAPGDLQ